MYSSYDKVGKGHITLGEFVDTGIAYFSPSFDDKLRLVFALLDFNSDARVESEDIHTLISHMPLQKMVRLGTCIW